MRRTTAISHYCRGLCAYGRSRGHWETFARGNEVPCDIWDSCLRLSFVLEARLLWSFLWLAQWFLHGLYCKGFWSRGRVSPCTSLLIGHNVCTPMYWFVTVLRRAREGVGVDSPKVTVSCRLGAYWLYLGYSTTERDLNSVCVSRGALSLSCFLLPHPRGCRTTDNTPTKHSRYSTVCKSTNLFDCVSTFTDAVAPTRYVRWTWLFYTPEYFIYNMDTSLVSSCLFLEGTTMLSPRFRFLLRLV